MQGIEATFDDLSFEGGDSPQRVLPKIVPGVAALALAGAVGVWALHWLGPIAPDSGFSRWTPSTTAGPAISKPFGDIAIDASLLAQLKSGVPASLPQVASLEAAPTAPFPLPSLDAFPSASAPASPPSGEPAAAAGARFARDRRDGELPLAARPSAWLWRSDPVHDAR